jgi:hypothetical protein
MAKNDKFFFVLMIICILIVIALFWYMTRETSRCVKNPFVYGASKMGNIQCSCSQDVNRITPAYFSFNDTTLDLSPHEIKGGLYVPVDWGNLTIKP